MVTVGEPSHRDGLESDREPELVRVLAGDFAKEEATGIRIGEQAAIRRDGSAINGDVGRVGGEANFARSDRLG
jgi:hypothetical protein